MAYLNRVTLIGRVGVEPKYHETKTGKMATFSLATTESYTDKNTGGKVENTEWHSITVFNQGLVKLIEKKLKKGMLVFAEGVLSTRKYTNKEGVETYTTSVVLKQFTGDFKILDWNNNNNTSTTKEFSRYREDDETSGDVTFTPDEYEKLTENTEDQIVW